MNISSRFTVVSLGVLVAFSGSALEIGPETPVTGTTGVHQTNVVISRDSLRTLIAFDEAGKVVLHQYEIDLGLPQNRETFAAQASASSQFRPELGSSMLAWLEEEPNGGPAALWWQALGFYSMTDNFAPEEAAERVAEVRRGTSIAVLNSHVFHVIVWTAPDGRLNAVYRSLMARIGYDRSPFVVTSDEGVHPAVAALHSLDPIVAYNHPISTDGCTGTCPQRYSIRATTFRGGGPHPAIDIAPVGASAPRVVHDGKDFIVFWSMEDGATYAQRVSAGGPVPVKIGDVRKIANGMLHDASFGRDEHFFVVVERGPRFRLLRLDEELNVVEDAGFSARVGKGERMSLSSYPRTAPMLAYSALRPDGTAQAVFRVVGEDGGVRRRRSVR